jgi:ribose transport system ATP-binding protein
MPHNSTLCLVARGISKAYGATRALESVDFTVEKGEIHALVGENGAGKSTLVKILSGSVKPDEGTIEVEGESVELSAELSSRMAIVVVHQELSLLQNLTVAENIFVGNVPVRAGSWSAVLGVIDRRKLLDQAKASLELMGFEIDSRTPVAHLSQAQRQLVEITRALAQSPRLILFDEPTSSLSPDQRDSLFRRIKRISAMGVGVVFITHFLEEALQICDRITVLRDGRNVATLVSGEANMGRLIELMSGRPAGTVFPNSKTSRLGEVAMLSVDRIASRPKLREVSFDVGHGEIVGLAGLVGSGRTEALKAVFGITPIESGAIRIDGREVTFRSPSDAIAAGIAFIPEDRQDESIFQNHSVMNNICIAAVCSARDGLLKRWGFLLNRGRMAASSERLVADLRIKASSIDAPITSLSGGNQQKAVFARWLATKPSILLADEPTRGVSIGSKIEIYRLIRELAAEGAAVVIASSEFEELVGLCNRIFIMRDGVTRSETAAAGMTAHDLLHLVLAQTL